MAGKARDEHLLTLPLPTPLPPGTPAQGTQISPTNKTFTTATARRLQWVRRIHHYLESINCDDYMFLTLVINYQQKLYRGLCLNTNDVFNMEIKTWLCVHAIYRLWQYMELLRDMWMNTLNIMAIYFKYCNVFSGIPWKKKAEGFFFLVRALYFPP